jgi:signal transduction histidine kinase
VVKGFPFLRHTAGTGSPQLKVASPPCFRCRAANANTLKSGSLERAPLDINEFVREALSLIRSEAGKRRVHLEMDLETGLPPILADRVQIQQVLMNLCINGLDAMESVGDRRRTLSLRTRSHEPWEIRVEVQDSGAGLREPDRIFEAFFTTKQNGICLGLSISRSIIELHNGRL